MTTIRHLVASLAAAVAAAVAALAGAASALGIFARGDGTFETVTSARGEIYEDGHRPWSSPGAR